MSRSTRPLSARSRRPRSPRPRPAAAPSPAMSRRCRRSSRPRRGGQLIPHRSNARPLAAGMTAVLCDRRERDPTGSTTSGCSHEHSPARFRRPRTCAGVEDRGLAAGDETLVRAGQCRHRARSRMRGARHRRPCRGDRISARRNAVDLVVVGPETPLAAGIVDDLARAGIKAFGPSKQAAQLEGSKGFTKALCTEFNIPTGAYGRFDNAGRCAGLCARSRARRSWSRPTGSPPARASWSP